MKRAEQLVQMMDYCDQIICLELLWDDKQQQSGQCGYRGDEIYNTMLSLGLEYDSDMGCFNCFNGFLNLFRVGSNTYPLKQLDLDILSSPSSIFKDITFECFIPHCKYPFDTLQSMFNAGSYTQKKLGGVLKDYYTGQILQSPPTLVEREVRKIVDTMNKCGVAPGSVASFELFD